MSKRITYDERLALREADLAEQEAQVEVKCQKLRDAMREVMEGMLTSTEVEWKGNQLCRVIVRDCMYAELPTGFAGYSPTAALNDLRSSVEYKRYNYPWIHRIRETMSGVVSIEFLSP